jgi:uncharacterized protein (DUF2062 family)
MDPSTSMRRVVYRLRTEGGGPSRDAVAIAVGVFVGCSPFYGFHLAICWVLGRVLRLNRLKMYLAANVSNPLIAPALILSELQVGAWIRRREFHAFALDTLRSTDPWIFGADLLIGSAVVGGVLATFAGLTTWWLTRAADDDTAFATLVQRASDRYVSTSITAWEFARGKLRTDPVYRTVLKSGVLPSGGVLVDVGCGQGLMLALLAEAAAMRDAALPWRVPVFDRLIGIDVRPRVARLAARVLGQEVTIVAADARSGFPEKCRAALFFDLLHMVPRDDQESLLAAASAALEPDGVILVREANAAGGWRFAVVRVGNRLKALLFGHWRQRFHFRTASEWIQCFEGVGFNVRTLDASDGTPFANVLFVLTPAPLPN